VTAPSSSTVGAGRVVVVTGANGFLGAHFVRHLGGHGFVVRGLVRRPEAQGTPPPGVRWFRGDLPDHVDATAFAGAFAVVHCAYTSRFTTLEEARRTNEEGSARVLALSRAAGVPRFVFLSTTSAHPAARSYYGRSKLADEETLDLERDTVLRSGLVLGAGGLAQRLARSMRRLGVVPLLDGGRQPIQTVWIDDLADAVEQVIVRGLAGRFVVAEPEGLTMRELFERIAARSGTKVRFVPVPASLLLAPLRACERLQIPLPLSSENVLGAIALRRQPSAEDLARLGIRARPVEESLDLLPLPGDQRGANS
jgi:nucleoside-diphosphate-sugar epimerase